MADGDAVAGRQLDVDRTADGTALADDGGNIAILAGHAGGEKNGTVTETLTLYLSLSGESSLL